jgi:hypothetical protein
MRGIQHAKVNYFFLSRKFCADFAKIRLQND